MADLLPLVSLNWHSDTCPCKVEPRRYHIYREPMRIVRDGGARQIVPERVWCHLHKLDGSITEIPMRITTIGEMAASGLRPDYWAESLDRQIERIARTEELLREIAAERTPLDRADPEWLARFGDDPEKAAKMAALMPDPRDFCGWEGILEVYRVGKTYADHEGYRRSPGTQDRGHLSHRCPRHHNQTSTDLLSRIWKPGCGCVIRQIVVGERAEGGVTHEQWIELCPRHVGRVNAA